MSARGRFATPAQSLYHDNSPCRGLDTYAAKAWTLSIVQGPFSVARAKP
jgi:hypothetical protein